MLSTETLQPADPTLAPPANPAAPAPADAPAPAAITTPDAFIAAFIAANFNFAALARTIPAATFLPLIRSPEVRAALDDLIHFFESCATLRSAELRELALDHLATIIKTKSASPIETRRAATTILRASSRPSQPRQPREPREPRDPRPPRPEATPEPTPDPEAESKPAPAGPSSAPPLTARTPSARDVLTDFTTRLASIPTYMGPDKLNWLEPRLIRNFTRCGTLVFGYFPDKATKIWADLRPCFGKLPGEITTLPEETEDSTSLIATLTFPRCTGRPDPASLQLTLTRTPTSSTPSPWLIADITPLKPTNTS